MQELFLGIMTGTSLDAVDLVLASFDDQQCQLKATLEHPFPPALKKRLQALIEDPHKLSLDELGSVDRELGLLYAEAVHELIRQAGFNKDFIRAIGCHGQTIRHRPDLSPAFTMQIGDAATLANETGIVTVADFRSADIALGGQGAPLAPLFHSWLIASPARRCAVVNIGGIANISVISPSEPLLGFDTGPGNTLLDYWCAVHTGVGYDQNGAWAEGGTVVEDLLNNMLADEYLRRPAPKSTGREYFNKSWLEHHLAAYSGVVSPQDVQATLAELTAVTIANEINHYSAREVWLCGGGTANHDLVNRLKKHTTSATVRPIDELGIPAAWIEATAIAWLARARLAEEAVGDPNVTGARKAAVLGAVHQINKA